MKCPECKEGFTEVFDSRLGGSNGRVNLNDQLVYRRRRCFKCGHRFATHEKPIGEGEDNPHPLKRLAIDLELILLRYERDSKDEARTLGRAVVLLEQVTTAVARAYQDSAALEAGGGKSS